MDTYDASPDDGHPDSRPGSVGQFLVKVLSVCRRSIALPGAAGLLIADGLVYGMASAASPQRRSERDALSKNDLRKKQHQLIEEARHGRKQHESPLSVPGPSK